MKTSKHILATWFGLGYLKPAPGTWGTLGGLAVFYALAYLNELYPIFQWPQLMLFLTALLFFVGVVTADRFEKETGEHDSSKIVIDEVVGIFLVLIWAYQTPGNFWTHGLMGFVLFRIFDIWKPFPIKDIEKRFSGGMGVMIDDVIAAFYAIIAYSFIGKITAEIFFR